MVGSRVIKTKLPGCVNGYKKLKSSNRDNTEIGLEFTCFDREINQPPVGYSSFFRPIVQVNEKNLNCPNGKVLGRLAGKYTDPGTGIGEWNEVDLNESNCVDYIPPKKPENPDNGLTLQSNNDNTLYTLAILIIFLSILIMQRYLN